MQEQNRSNGKDPNFLLIKKFGTLIGESETKQQFREKLNGMLRGMQTNCIVTPTKMEKIRLLECFKTKF